VLLLYFQDWPKTSVTIFLLQLTYWRLVQP
jgi:hypothetical protein